MMLALFIVFYKQQQNLSRKRDDNKPENKFKGQYGNPFDTESV